MEYESCAKWDLTEWECFLAQAIRLVIQNRIRIENMKMILIATVRGNYQVGIVLPLIWKHIWYLSSHVSIFI